MDPNETLHELRLAVEAISVAPDLASKNVLRERVVELFVDLDTWMSNGGFSPDAWLKQ